MPFDRTEYEPEEYDPEAEFRDPESDAMTIPEVSQESPSVAAPEVSIPEISTETDELDVPSELLTHFWALVLVLNGAILAIALAVLFVIFEGSTTRSGGLLVVGLVLSGFAYHRYRAYQALDLDANDADPGDGDSGHATGDCAPDTDSRRNGET